MRTRLLPAAVAGLLTVSLLGLAPATAEPREVPVRGAPAAAPQSDRQAAVDALAAAEALFAETDSAAARRITAGRPDATMVLNQLVRVRPDLSPADRKRANALLARPTDPEGDFEGAVRYEVPEREPFCGDTVCIHYVASTDDAPPMTDADTDGVPDSVEQVLETAESVNDTYVAAGYRRPDPDGSLGGGSGLVDIYLADLGALDGLYGYCTTDQPGNTGPWNRWAYCAIDEDFSVDDFPLNTPLQNQRVTLAHEYFHAIQYAYDAYEDPWFLEATAAWAEDELFDGVNDNRQYLPYGQLGRPYVSLDLFGYELNHYGNWLFFRHLTERWTAETGGLPTLKLELMERVSGRSGDPDQYSTQAIAAELAERGTSFGTVYARFATDNRAPARAYSEGAAYRAARPLQTWRLRSDLRRTGRYEIRIDHLANETLRYRPGTGTRARSWKLRLQVDMPAPATAPAARVVSFLKGGGVSTRTIPLSSTGKGARTVPFSSRRVRHVELVLVNASRRTTSCGSGSPYACQGQPRDDLMRTVFSATISR